MSEDKKLVIIGAGGHGKVVADIAEKCGYTDISFLDDNASGSCIGFPITGKTEDIMKYVPEYDFFVAVGNSAAREKITEEVESAGGKIVSLIHPDSVIGKCVEIGKGTVVMAGVVINPGTEIGKSVIINTSSSVDHDCNIGDYSHIAVGAHVCGTVNIGTHVWVGAGSTVINNVDICDNCFIGAGAAVVKNIAESGKYIGVPAKKM